VPAPGLLYTGDGVINAPPIEVRNAPLRDPGVVRAFSKSLLLHAALFLALVGGFRIDRPGLAPQIVLPLEVELVDGRELLNLDPAPSDEPAQAASTPAASTQAGANTASAVSALATSASSPSEPAPGLPEHRDAENRSDESVPGEAPAPRDSEALPLTAEQDSDVPLSSNDPADPQRVAMPVSQQAMLTRRLMEGVRNFDDPSELPAQWSWEHAGQSYTALASSRPAADTDIEYLDVEVQSQDEGQRMRTRLAMRRLAFSHFTQLVDRWDPKVQLHDDEIAGRFHSNSVLVIGYGGRVMPRFLGKVSTAARRFTFGDSTGRWQRADIFREGLETGADRIAFPRRYLQPPAGGAQAHTFFHDTRIIFHADGSYEWAEPRSPAVGGRRSFAAPAYLFGSPRATLFVRGVVAGQVTVYSPDRLVIEGDLTYANHPRDVPGTQDCLGLVSDKDIEIARPDVTGPGDLEIDAALYARRRFIVTDIDTPSRATLSIYGSLAAGSLTATEPRYATKIRFDERFERLRPPGFPGTNRYEVDGWDASWEPAEEGTPATTSTPASNTKPATPYSATSVDPVLSRIHPTK
jgi:hypothetical protein